MIESTSTDKLRLITESIKNIPVEILEDILKNRVVNLKITWTSIELTPGRNYVAVPQVELEISDK